MASLIKDSRGRSPYWIACYTSADGRRLKKSTKTADRCKARAIADAWESVEAQARGGTLTELQVRNVIAATLERVTGKKPFDPTVREWLGHWTKSEEGTVKPGTLAKYRRVAKTFLKHLGRKADQRLETVTARDVLEFRRALLDEGRAPGTLAFRQTKTGGEVVIPLHPQFLEHLLSLPAPDRAVLPLFPTLHELPKTGTRSPGLTYQRLRQRAGVDAGTGRTRRGKAGRSTSRLSFHSFRHSFNSRLANSGVPQEVRQKLTGHRSAEINAL
jgi:hypothetical protein